MGPDTQTRPNRGTAVLAFAALPALIAALAVSTVAQQRFPTAEEMPGHLVDGECQDCHPEIYDEWAASGHAFAWTSDLYQKTRQRFDHAKECDPCHAPRPVLATGLDAVPALRPNGQERGVDCLSCHLDADGAMHGPYGDRSPFHLIQRDFVLFTKNVRLCTSCHGQALAMAHNEVKEFLSSPSHMQGEGCQTCHMPESTRKPSRYSRSEKRSTDHSFPGSRSAPRLENTLLLDFDRGPDGVTVYLTNAAGHAIPAAPLREIRLEMVLRSADGEVIERRVERFRHPLGLDSVPIEPGAPDTRPRAGEFRQYLLPAGTHGLAGAELSVDALYRRSDGDPWMAMASIRHALPRR